MLESVLAEVKLSEKDFKTVSDLVYKYCGINLHQGKRELVRARLAKRLRQLKMRTFSEYIKYATNDPTGKEFTTLIDTISTNLTSFFREKQHFDYLNNVYFPEMLAKKKARNSKKIRVWSAGCSSGEEPYSIAITLLDLLATQQNWDIKILATDISTQILDKAKKGVYEPARVEPVSAHQKQKYLIKIKEGHDTYYQAGPNLKKIIYFARLNLMEQWPVQGPLEFIFCRNVMIYFDKPTQQKLVNRYWELLDSGGLLFTGHSESLTGIKHKFAYVQPTIYKKP
jgi:chemotaxis protein methyltransferase CheR